MCVRNSETAEKKTQDDLYRSIQTVWDISL